MNLKNSQGILGGCTTVFDHQGAVIQRLAGGSEKDPLATQYVEPSEFQEGSNRVSQPLGSF